ncbi:MAG: hypothetical protein IJ184_06620 [Alphaproteobacteria bacterium]|nr:hypothetical protein [Alphaproteobacteria bacterium]
MLARQELREAVLSKLKENSALKELVGDNIFNSKVTPFEGKNLPGINVVTIRQDANSRSLNVQSFNCTLKVNVEIYVSPITNWTAKADAIAEAVETALMTDAEFTKLFSQTDNYTVEYSMYDQGAHPIVVEILSFSLSYFEEYHVTAEDDLQKTHIDVDVIEPIADPVPGPDERIEFQLEVNHSNE